MNNTFKKGLISFVAASMLSTASFASTTMTVNTHDLTNGDDDGTVTTATTSSTSGNLKWYNGSGVTSFNVGTKYNHIMSIDINSTESSTGNFAIGGDEEISVVFPANVGLVLSRLGTNNVCADTNTVITDTNITSGSGKVVVDANGTASTSSYARLLLDLTGSGSEYFCLTNLDYNTTGIQPSEHNTSFVTFEGNSSLSFMSSASSLDINSSFASSDAIDENKTQTGTITTSNGAITLKMLIKNNRTNITDTNAPMSILLNDINLSADTDGTGTASVTVSGANNKITSKSVVFATLYSTPVVLTTDSTVNGIATTNIPSTGTDSNGSFYDFNLTIRDNVASQKDGNFSLLLSAGKFEDISIVANSTGYTNDTYTVTADGNKTLTISPEGNTTLGFRGSMTTASVAEGTTVSINFSSGEGNFSNLTSSTQSAVSILNVAANGITVANGTSGQSVATNLVLVGKSNQAVIDVNLSEKLKKTFTSGGIIKFTLPTGYSFYTGSAGTTNGVTITVSDSNYSSTTSGVSQVFGALSSSNQVFTVGIADGNTTSSFDKNDSAIQTAKLSSMKINVPSTATSGDKVTLSVDYTNASSKTFTSSIDIATVTNSSATSELNATGLSLPTGQTVSGKFTVDVNETVAGSLPALSTIVMTLNKGKFASAGTATATASLSSTTPTLTSVTDTNDTLTFTVNTASTTASGLTFPLPDFSLSGVAADTALTLTLSGTAGVAGTLALGTTFDPANATSTTGAIVPLAIDATGNTGLIVVEETNYAPGVLASKQIKIQSQDGELSLNSASYITKIGSGTEGTSYTSMTCTASGITFLNDTLTCTLPSTLTSSTIDKVTIKVNATVKSTATAGKLLKLKVTDVDSGAKAASDLEVVYVGSSLPTLTAVADTNVSIGGTVSVVPTGSLGTVTYASNDVDGNITVDSAGLVTVGANTAVASTATITATDSKLGTSVTTVVTASAATPTTLSGDITLAAGWNFVSAPFDGSIDIATIVAAGCSQVHLVDTTTGFWGAAATTGTAVPGQGVAAYCAAAGTASYTGVTAATTPFSMATNITGTGSTAVPSTHAAYAVGANFKVVGTPTATTFADVITAGATGVMYYNGTAFDLSSEYTSAGFTGVADNAAQTIPAGASFYIQTN